MPSMRRAQSCTDCRRRAACRPNSEAELLGHVPSLGQRQLRRRSGVVGWFDPVPGSTVNASDLERPEVGRARPWSTGRRPRRPWCLPNVRRPRRRATSGRRCPALGGATLFITSTAALRSREKTTVAVPPVGMSPDTVRTSGAAKICSAVVGFGSGRMAQPMPTTTNPTIERGGGGSDDALPVPALGRRESGQRSVVVDGGQQPVTQLGGRIDGRRGGHHRHGLAHGAHFVGEGPRDELAERRPVGVRSASCSACDTACSA